MAVCKHGMPLSFGCDDCTISGLNDQRKQDEALIKDLADALASCSSVPHWPSHQPILAAARTRLAQPTPAP